MHETSVHILLEPLIALARDAGAVVMRHYESGAIARKKADRSPVTDADEEAEALILSGLHKIEPDLAVIAEEEAAAGRMPQIGQRFFLVDPLNGTREFLNRNGEFTINIALIESGAPVLGVVFAPAQNRMFAGGVNIGAFEIAKGSRRAIAARTPPCDGMIAVASRSHRDHKTDEILSAYPVAQIVSAGSSIKFCLVAAGEADIYPRHGRTMEWDTAAGHAVLAAAGGRVTLLDGKSALNYGKAKEGFANPHFVAWGKETEAG